MRPKMLGTTVPSASRKPTATRLRACARPRRAMPGLPVQWRGASAMQRNPHWLDPVALCDTPALCDAANKKCATAACTVDQHTCASQNLLVCNAGRTGFIQAQTCGSAALCDAANGQCDICVPGNYSCDSAGALHSCSPDGQSNPIFQTRNSVAHCTASGSTGSLVCDVKSVQLHECRRAPEMRC
jgi:hypothetical protein